MLVMTLMMQDDPKRPHVEDAVAHRLHRRRECRSYRSLSPPGQHGDLALIGQMHAARDGQLHHPHRLLSAADCGQFQHLVASQG